MAAVSLLLIALAACASAPPRNPLAQWHGSPNYNPRRAQLIVLHHTDMDSAQGALQALSTPAPGRQVSSHYLIGADGHLYQLVADQDRAWHAGIGRWGELDDLNSASIGIELDNDGSAPFAEAQIQTLLRLLQDLTTRLNIAPQALVAHGDIAPTRKNDPSALFPWKRLADAGYGLWPRADAAAPPAGFDPWAAMRLIGYDLRDPAAARRAFQRRFRGRESEDWLPGDDAVLYDLQRQLMAMPAPAP
ncbi:N-acetylmuramoyl-L-alanine amidase [Lysobacter silvisoli]|uniref:N-acetylmuramoyl-L-alanine amidase n=1 Tax=Lysobacter silvisoli TaxID=2293254 RepID=A0A371JZY0_9GAMM|nr:N-acetylmuramoyl-L-alanine amidase [Lysobacter silvisoli]RDZ27226.1 N-acetylmuramoyl-L-alanine amidase [Lysobacter silvisoli]